MIEEKFDAVINAMLNDNHHFRNIMIEQGISECSSKFRESYCALYDALKYYGDRMDSGGTARKALAIADKLLDGK